MGELLRRFARPGARVAAAWRSLVAKMGRGSQRYRLWRARHQLAYIESRAWSLPTQDQRAATIKRMRHYEAHVREGAGWNVSRRVMEARLMADEHIRTLRSCARAAGRVARMDSAAAPSNKLAERLRRVLGETPQSFASAEQGFRDYALAWREIADEARHIKTPVMATQAFSNLSDRSGLEVVTLVLGGLFVLGAVHMLFFYRAAADEFVFMYWMWEDMVIEAINMAPILAVVLALAEALFRFVRWIGERLGLLWGVLFIVHHPALFAVVLSLLLTASASWWGYFRGLSIWYEFDRTGGVQSAAILDGTVLTNAHLVGTTSSAAVFLRAASPTTAIERRPPSYADVTRDIVCALPVLQCDAREVNETYFVYVIDRDKVVCHARGPQCADLPGRLTGLRQRTESD